jgi:hemerythrin
MEPSKSAWEKQQQLGIAAIVTEHTLQGRLVAVLRDAVEGGRDAAVVGEILRRVEDTSNVHFMSEELLMRLDAYDQYGAHVEQHRVLLAELAEVRARYEADPATDLRPTIGWIETWLADHIQGPDRRFLEAVARNKSATP